MSAQHKHNITVNSAWCAPGYIFRQGVKIKGINKYKSPGQSSLSGLLRSVEIRLVECFVMIFFLPSVRLPIFSSGGLSVSGGGSMTGRAAAL